MASTDTPHGRPVAPPVTDLPVPDVSVADSVALERPPQSVPEAQPPTESGWKRGLANSLAFVRRRMTGDYEVDNFGYDPDFHDTVIEPPLRLLYEKWFRIEALGLENIPDTGGALL